ncbi:homeotic protein ultrabithorax-like [Lycorma delicatula]|uniref:homeotic protein ultrabithorax-like n=1 Tax=Lycorma delicatula TaxID=130591 RepID=UPI003F50D699
MNSYFEQTGFYGSHHHQAAGAAAGHHHEQSAAAAAYRFPLGLGMSPYASSQHHHHHSLHQSRPPQDSPYDASVAAACKLYSSSNDAGQQSSINYSTSTKSDCSKPGSESSHQNGYAAVVAAAAKDVWQSAATGGSASVGPVRPAACTPDSRYASSVGLVGGDPASSPGAAGGGRTSSTSSWNTCSLGSSASQPTVGTQLHQQPTNHTFYPWMAIAGTIVQKFCKFLFSPPK